MRNIVKSTRKHPKIVATIVFLLLVAGISFTFGYKQDMDRKGKDGNDYSTSHHIMNGLKWMGIVLAIFTLIAVMIVVVFDMSFWEMFFFGGDFINMIGRIVIELIGVLSN
jgi:hypothetical protein